jgi:hypothetical protein
MNNNSSDSDTENENSRKLNSYWNASPEKRKMIAISINNDKAYRSNIKKRESAKKLIEKQKRMPFEIINGRKALLEKLDKGYRYIYVDSLDRYVKLKPVKAGFLDENGRGYSEEWFSSYNDEDNDE